MGQTSIDEVSKILDYAHSHNIASLDTAAAYGTAIDVVGKYQKSTKQVFKAISKFKSSSTDLIKEVELTLEKLGINQLFGYLMHDFDCLDNKHLLSQIAFLKQKNLIEHTGISIYTNEQLEKAVDIDSITIIQLPFNLLDNWTIRGKLIEKAKRKGKIIHTRSTFLQGLFFVNFDKIPSKLIPLQPYIVQLKQIAKDYNLTIESLALNYVLHKTAIDGVLIGVDTQKQLANNINIILPSFETSLVEAIEQINVKEIELLNPVNWSKN
jgi:aryl-alcohol dehydrogenase-like predicted oxidoreductase